MLNDLKKSEKVFRTVFENTRDAILLADPNGRILEVNQACIDLFGYKTKDAFIYAIVTVEGLFEDSKDYQSFQKSDSHENFVNGFETRLVDRKDREFKALINWSVIHGGEGKSTGRVLLIKDILKNDSGTPQRERRRNIRLGILLAISNTVSSSLDLSKVLKNTTDKMLEILEPDSVRIYLLDSEKKGLHLVTHKGLSRRFISKKHMRYREIGDGLLGQVVVTGKTKVVDNFLRIEDPYVTSFLEEGLQCTVYIPFISKGKPIGVMAVSSHSMFKFSDYHVEILTSIGNHVGMAVENAHLYEDLKAAYQELKEAQEQVLRTEKLASLGKLSATIAHEINNPLAAVLTYIKLMMKLIERGKFTEAKVQDISRYLKTMDSEIARCGEIVKNLLAFSRQSKTTVKPHSLEEILEKTLMLIAHDLEIKGIQQVKWIEPDLPEIRCDFKQIQQAFLNLMGNASEAMKKGGTLNVRAARSIKKGLVEVDISDTGCGISKKDLPKIFEPFFTTKEEGKGVGLGLSVVFGIITKHKGTVEVTSEPGKGSTFKVQLPAA